MDFSLTKQQLMVQKTIRSFTNNEIRPIAAAVDRYEATIEDNLTKLAKLGLFSIVLPSADGSFSGDCMSYVIAVEEVSRACASTGTALSGRMSGLVIEMLYREGTPEQKEKYLAPQLRGELCGCFGLTEPEAGSDAGRLTTIAVPDEDWYIINGQKAFITGGRNADFAIVMAKTDPAKGTRGITAFLVDKGTPGFTSGKDEMKMGIHGVTTNELVFKDVRVHKSAILGKENNGFRQAMISLDSGRLGIAAQALGIAQGAYDEAVKYSKERVQFGGPISNNQAIQWMLVDMRMKIEAARLLVYRAAYRKQQNHPSYSMDAAMAKLYAAQTAMWVTTKAVQIHGGYGYMMEYPVERMMRDAKITEIYEGTNEIQYIVIARNILRGR
ncbi:MAG: acyl-CoA dehydrogenase family protein [Saccharofermentanales bacterium]|jgi:butyryl-CoA dehydrogenase